MILYILFNFMFNSGNDASVLSNINAGPAKEIPQLSLTSDTMNLGLTVGPDGTAIVAQPAYFIINDVMYKGMIDPNNGKIIAFTTVDLPVPGKPVRTTAYLDLPAGTEVQVQFNFIRGTYYGKIDENGAFLMRITETFSNGTVIYHYTPFSMKVQMGK